MFPKLLHTLSTMTLFYAVSWNLNFKALYVFCRGEFFWHSWDITGVWESFWRVRWLLYYFFVILLMNVNKTSLNISFYNIFKTKKSVRWRYSYLTHTQWLVLYPRWHNTVPVICCVLIDFLAHCGYLCSFCDCSMMMYQTNRILIMFL